VSPATVTVDGPAASGKSTTSRRVARALSYRHLNSGLLYRAVTWAALRGDWLESGAFRERLDELELELRPEAEGYRVRVDRAEPGGDLHSREVTARVSEVAAKPAVRERVNRLLRREAGRGDVVCDGRDMGTAVFPEADLKIWLTASPEERARRRVLEGGDAPDEERIREEAARIRARDERDSRRRADPLRKPADAVVVDTTDLAPHEVVERIVREARRRGLPGTGRAR